MEQQRTIIFTDGACSGNPGPGGWGSIVALPDGNVQELGGGEAETTNNRMELTATIRALAALPLPATEVVLYTDSTYVIRGITQWIWGWRSRGWKNSEGKDVANRDLWEALAQAVARLKPANIAWKYVKGHAGFAGNERCDQIAVDFSQRQSVSLYKGPRLNYFVDLDHIPEEQPLPEAKSASAGKTSGGKPGGPVTYLSLHGGVVVRHSTWAACEKRVKGQSNAKFKKARSSQEENDILSAWGLDPRTAVIEE